MHAEQALILDEQRRFWRAANTGDRATLDELLDEGFAYIEANGLERKNKADFIADISEPGAAPAVLSFELVNVRVEMSGDLAVAFAQFHIEQEEEDERFRSSGNAIEVFARRDGRWKIVASVFGEVPPFIE